MRQANRRLISDFLALSHSYTYKQTFSLKSDSSLHTWIVAPQATFIYSVLTVNIVASIFKMINECTNISKGVVTVFLYSFSFQI